MMKDHINIKGDQNVGLEGNRFYSGRLKYPDNFDEAKDLILAEFINLETGQPEVQPLKRVQGTTDKWESNKHVYSERKDAVGNCWVDFEKCKI